MRIYANDFFAAWTWELIEYVIRLLGMYLTGDIREQHLWIFQGDGMNGKSYFALTLCLYIMGGYAGTAPESLLVQKQTIQNIPTELADLQGKARLCNRERNRIQYRGCGFNLWKHDSHGRCDDQRSDSCARICFEFKRTHKLIMQTNHLPIVLREDSIAV